MKKLNVKASTIANYLFRAEKHIQSSFSKMKIIKLSLKKIWNSTQCKLNIKLSAEYIPDIILILIGIAKYAAKFYFSVIKLRLWSLRK